MQTFPTTIVLLQGASSVGKTTLCNEIERLDSRWKTITNVSAESLLALLKKDMPDIFNVLSQAIAWDNIYHAIQYNQILFIENISEEAKQKAFDALVIIRDYVKQSFNYRQEWAAYVLNKAHQMNETGHNIIIDTVLLNQEDIAMLKKSYNVIVVLAYAPLGCMLERLIKRNELSMKQNNLKQMRSLKHPFFYYAMLHEFSFIQDSYCIDMLHKDDLSRIFNKADVFYSAINKTSPLDFSLHEWNAYKKSMLSCFEDASVVFIKCKYPYDFLLKMEGNVQESAQNFLNALKNR